MEVETFGQFVQKHLRASGHTQQKLATEVGLHPKVLSRKFHGTDASLTQRDVREIINKLAEWRAIHSQEQASTLLKAAGMGPSLFSKDEWQSPPLNTLTPSVPQSIPEHETDPQAMKHNLPAPTTRLIGRDWAVARLKLLIERKDVRLVTLVGAGGSGKTRLALHLATKLLHTYTHGVWLIPLSGVTDPDQVPMTISQILQIQSSPELPTLQSLIAYLRNKHMLLLLDNFEHLEAATRGVAEILTAAPNIKILVTSRAVLHIYGEREFSIPPLDIPDPRMVLATEKLQYYGAIQLFVERAQAIQPDFTLTEANANLIAQICARVDGLPLALELAAARVKVLPPAQLLERLTNASLPVLTGGAKNLPGRQQTLRNTIHWSYKLLSTTDQARFRRLGVFTNGWSLETAEALMKETMTPEEEAGVSTSTLDLLEQFLDQSLLIQQTSADKQTRFTMLETLREYALEQLSKHGELARLRDWHACHYLLEVETAESGLKGPEQLTWMARMDADHDNIRAALEWLLQKARGSAHSQHSTSARQIPPPYNGDVHALEMCLRLAAAFRPYWEWRGFLTEGRYWLKTVLEVPEDETIKKSMLAARAKALSESSRLMWLQNNQSQAVELAEKSIALWKRLDNPRGLATALLHRGWAAHGMGEFEVARRLYQEGLDLLSEKTDPWLYAMLLFHLAAIVGFLSEFHLMRSYYAQSQRIFEHLGDQCSCADLLKDYGGLLILEGSYTESIDRLLQSLKICISMNHKQFITTGMVWLSFAFGMRKEPDPARAAIQAAQLRGMADHLMAEIGMQHWAQTLEMTRVAEQHIRSFIPEQEWTAALVHGHSLTVKQAIELAALWREGRAE